MPSKGRTARLVGVTARPRWTALLAHVSLCLVVHIAPLWWLAAKESEGSRRQHQDQEVFWKHLLQPAACSADHAASLSAPKLQKYRHARTDTHALHSQLVACPASI
jgi:hypothetical protein